MSFTLAVCTTKGAFLLNGDADRGSWSLTGPHCDLWTIEHRRLIHVIPDVEITSGPLVGRSGEMGRPPRANLRVHHI